ncbi:hypothetical protein [Mycolicibacterium frederiksbergense]|uniref:Uncharacterized protein n=1 Tax=Mycolicibacterium frederiksbergense TaxID=117567 RepID=A0A6H0S1T4_9MYCO|nr:hypothetical protein [Mycolicibacterium frederiksbergense]QIV80409.1 hypothetical protein EXE63_05495 [Mycolicibacterium frederiksbergense]
MKTLLEFIVRYVQVLYLNPAYRFTDSRTRGLADIDASVSISSDQLRWEIANDRGQIGITVAPLRYANDENWFWLSLIRQYLDGGSDTEQGSSLDLAEWLTQNLVRVEALFADEATAPDVCAKLVALRRSNSYKNWGWPKPGPDDIDP